MSESVRRSLCESVDSSILMGHMQELARWVKLSGTPDELESLRYFHAKLDEYGYRTRLIMHDAYISLPGKARVYVDNHTLDSITHSFSRSSPANGVSGRLVYVGDGDESDFFVLPPPQPLSVRAHISSATGRARSRCMGVPPRSSRRLTWAANCNQEMSVDCSPVAPVTERQSR